MEKLGTTQSVVREDARKEVRKAVLKAMAASTKTPAELNKAIDDAAKAILKGLRPNAPYAD